VTYEELLADIASKNYRESRTLETPYAALRVVAELHRPIFRGCDDDKCCGSIDTCHHCGNEYPCQTIKAIEQELA